MPITDKEHDLRDIREFFDSLDKIRAKQASNPTAGDYSRIARLALENLQTIRVLTSRESYNPFFCHRGRLFDRVVDESIAIADAWWDRKTIIRTLMGM